MGIVTRCWMIKVNQIGAIKHPVSHFCAFAGKFRKQRRTNSQATTHEQRSRFETANRVVRSEQWVCSSRIFAFYSFLNIFCQIKFSPRKPFRKAVMQHVCWISLKVNHRNSDVEVIKTKQRTESNLWCLVNKPQLNSKFSSIILKSLNLQWAWRESNLRGSEKNK